MDCLDPFLTFYRDHPDHDRGDARQEAASLLERQTAIQQWLEGSLPDDCLYDLLAQQGIEPGDYLDSVHSNLEFVFQNGIPFQSNESGLLLPVNPYG